MALTNTSTITEAIAQYNDNLTYWSSPTVASSCLEAVMFILQHDPKMYTLPNFTLQREDLLKLAGEIRPFAAATDGTTSQQRRTFLVGRAG